MARPRKKKDDVIVVKKYANRRLYDTGRSSYVTLEDLAEMIREGQEFVVQDAKSGEDLTQTVLTQIIVEMESRGQKILPTDFLKQVISFYGDNLQSVLPEYLNQTIDAFSKNQEQLREQMEKTMDGSAFQMDNIQEINKRNLEMFQQTMQMFSPMALFSNPSAMSMMPAGMTPTSQMENIRKMIEHLQSELHKFESTKS